MTIKKAYILVLSFFLFFGSSHAQDGKYSDKFNLKGLEKGKEYLPHIIIVKLKAENRTLLDSKIKGINGLQNSVLKTEKMFPKKEPLEFHKNKSGQELVDLSLIYTLSINGEEAIEPIMDKLHHSGIFEYVEPYLIPQLLYTPNDPLISNQYYLEKIRAYEAWGLTGGQGDTNVVIGIVDTGTDLMHPDLVNSIKYNYQDPINGIDDENDGYIDDYNGWDLGEGNNNPQWDINWHGVNVSGVAAAKANNGTGIAGVGFKCKFLPVKITDEFGSLTMSYQGIAFAADKGCKVINCSWGRPGGPAEQFEQDVINYATYNRGALVVAAAGNNNNEQLFYPASYQNVISVAATDENDLRWVDLNNGSGSTYNYAADICAPGHSIYTTDKNGSYTSTGGTSLAAPIVSGCAAIVASYFPTYLPEQITQRLKVTADVIDTIMANTPYAEKLGSGRVNLYRALTQTNIPSVNMISFNHTSEEFGQFSPGDTIQISGEFVNYLSPTTYLICTLRSLSPYVKVLDSVISFPNPIPTLGTANNFTFPFKIVVKANMPSSTKVDFRLFFNDINYTEKQYFSEVFNIDYITIDTNKITTTFTSKSRIGYNDNYRTQGLGFRYENYGISQLFIGGLIVGVSPVQVSDNIYGSAPGTMNNGFFNLVKAHKVMPPVFSDFDVQAVFNDSLVGSDKIKINVINNMYAWNNIHDEKFIIDEYLIINKDTGQLNNLYAGLFMDWELHEEKFHVTDFDQNLKMGYSYSTQGGYYTAIKLLTSGNYRFYAFDNLSGIKIRDGFTTYEKYTALRTNRFQAGVYSVDNDIASLLSSGPHYPGSGDTVKVAFAIIVGNDLTDIMQSAVNAQNNYDNQGNYVQGINKGNKNVVIYPNPSKDKIIIALKDIVGENCSIDIFDNLGRNVKSELVKTTSDGYQTIEININDLKSGVYLIRIKSGNITETTKFVIN